MKLSIEVQVPDGFTPSKRDLTEAVEVYAQLIVDQTAEMQRQMLFGDGGAAPVGLLPSTLEPIRRSKS